MKHLAHLNGYYKGLRLDRIVYASNHGFGIEVHGTVFLVGETNNFGWVGIDRDDGTVCILKDPVKL